MKIEFKKVFWVMGISSVLVTQAMAMANAPELVSQLPVHVFIPKGFDNNDNAQVIIDGWLPDTCHKNGSYKVNVDSDRKQILIENQVYIYPGVGCLYIVIPVAFKDVSTFKAMGFMPVTISKNPNSPYGPDDYLYAPVKDVFMENPRELMNRILILRGVFPDNCMSIQETRVKYKGNTIVVLPIAQHLGSSCQLGAVPFEIRVDLSQAPSGHELISLLTVVTTLYASSRELGLFMCSRDSPVHVPKRATKAF